ncbi:MAG: hypothetical protein ABI230_11150 [Aestuariivirga sp.]
MMTMNIRKLLFAGVILIATSGVAYGGPAGGCTSYCGGKPTPPPPQESHNNVFGDELLYGPISGAKSKPQVQVLGACRIKYSKEVEINAKWEKRFGRTGWWCTYKHKRT